MSYVEGAGRCAARRRLADRTVRRGGRPIEHTPAEVTPADDQLCVSLADRTAHIDPGYGTLEGALIAVVAPGSPAERAGLKARDIILKIDGVHVHDARQLRNRIGLLRAGQSADLEIERSGQRQTITGTIGSRS